MGDRVEARPTDGRVVSSNRPVPLNLKRLTGILLRQVARGLEIDHTGYHGHLSIRAATAC